MIFHSALQNFKITASMFKSSIYNVRVIRMKIEWVWINADMFEDILAFSSMDWLTMMGLQFALFCWSVHCCVETTLIIRMGLLTFMGYAWLLRRSCGILPPRLPLERLVKVLYSTFINIFLFCLLEAQI